MDTAFAIADVITANLGTIVTLAFAGIGVLSQVAALFNLGGLARFSNTLHDAVQFAAGNWGQALNAVKVLETYRSAGPAAALSQLAALAAARGGGSGGSGGSLPPGATPAVVLLAALVGLGTLGACAPITAKLDHLTSTTLAERCAVYRAGGLTGDVLAASFPELAGLAAVNDATVKVLCDQPSGALQVPKS